jgi:cytochrome c oxidase cbb3-type subunit 3
MTRRIVQMVGLVLLFLGAVGAALGQDSNEEKPASGPYSDLRGKSAFELRCATCHGLDGLGGEHAPDVIRRSAVRALSDQALLKLIHDGIPELGMPGFPDMSQEDRHGVVAYMRFLQGNSAGGAVQGDPARGMDLFFGKAGCSACHSHGQSISEGLLGFARDHQAGEIRNAILNPAGGTQETATAAARDGRKFSGIIRNEDNASLQLQDVDGRFYLLMKSSLVSVGRKTGDPMPVDYGQRLNTTELNDLVSYILREARAGAIPSPTSEKNEEPHPHADD